MAVDIHITYEGGLGCKATHGPSGAVLHTTPPVDNGGDGSRFSPTDLATTALATCVMTILAMNAERRGVDISGATARIEKHMTTEGPRRIASLPLVVHIPAAPSMEDRLTIEEAARCCPVCRTLGEHVERAIEFRWGSDGGLQPDHGVA